MDRSTLPARTLLLLACLSASSGAQQTNVERVDSERSLGGRGIVGASASVVLDSTVIRASAARTLADLLSSRVAGLNVTYATGAPGFAPEVSTRGASTLVGGARPFLYIDGVLQRDDPHALSPLPDGNRPAHAWSLPTEEIESVEVILGPVGGSLFEFGSPRGAILVRTRRPTHGRVELRSFIEALALEPGMAFPDVETTAGTTASGTTLLCTRAAHASGYCTQTGTVRSRPYGGGSLLRSGIGTRAGLSASGGSSRLGFRVSALGDEDAGQIAQSEMERVDLAAGLVGRVQDRVEVSFDARYARSNVQYAHWGENGVLDIGGMITPPIGASGLPDSTALDSTLAHAMPYLMQRMTLGLAATWRSRAGLVAFTRLGTDRATRESALTEGISCFRPGPTDCTYHRIANSSDQTSTGGTFGMRAARSLMRGVRLEGEAGVHVSLLNRNEFAHDSTWTGPSYTASSGAMTPDVRSRSIYGAARLDLTPNRFVAGGFRTEQTESSGWKPKQAPFMTAELGWTLSGEPFFPRNAILPTLRLRAAYGESGDHETEIGLSPLIAGPFGGARLVDHRGRIRSRELGIDASIANGALALRATAFDRFVSGALVPSAFGMTDQNAWATHGVEVTLSPRDVMLGAVRWRSALAISTAQSRLTNFASLSATPAYWARVMFSQGAPIGTIYTYGYTWADTSGDGVIVGSEVTRDANATRRGVLAPTRLLGFTSSIAWGDRVTAGVGVDGKGGHVKAEATRFMRCLQSLCRASYDATASLEDQAAATINGGSMTPVHDASFVRIRELWVRYTLPSRFVPRGMSGAALHVAAHQLATWTKYPGADPETGAFGEGNVQHWDLFSPRIPRTFSVRLDLQR